MPRKKITHCIARGSFENPVPPSPRALSLSQSAREMGGRSVEGGPQVFSGPGLKVALISDSVGKNCIMWHNYLREPGDVVCVARHKRTRVLMRAGAASSIPSCV